jgi:hypothetical protein
MLLMDLRAQAKKFGYSLDEAKAAFRAAGERRP